MRLRLAVAAALALVGCLSGASSALASGYQPQFDPQTSNVPYLGWRGENIRLVYCETTPWSTDPSAQYTATWSVTDWSDGPAPVAATASQVVVQSPGALYPNAHCARIDYTSQRALLALIHVDISDGSHTVASHDFYAGWMKLSKVSLDDGSGGTDVYDAPGWGSHNWLRARVYGELPLSGFSDLFCPGQGCIPGLPATIQLPSEDKANQPAGTGDTTTWWDDIAKRLAKTTSTDPFYSGSNAWRMWDIHDDMTDISGNVDADNATSSSSPPSGYSGPCVTTGVDGAPVADTSIDAVDNCQGGLAEEGPYSRIWPSLTTGLAIGPWDPLRWDETFLGDGKLDSGDVPMPSARVNFVIAPHGTGASDISGVGTLESLSKEDVYIRNPDVGHDAPHNLYAPFYRAYIPATLAELAGRAGISSGTDWQPGGNYPTTYNCATNKKNGVDCSYPYWENEGTLSTVTGGATKCARDFTGGTPDWRQTPTGDQGISTYSDEHGEAMVAYVPGWDFYYDAIIAANPGVITAGNGCDLGDVYPLGTAQVNAIAQYPGAPVPLDVDKTSNALNESVDNYFTRSVTCQSKGTTGADLLSQVCTAASVDIDNTGVQGANVCFAVTGAAANAVKPFPAGTASTTDAQGRLCETTDWSGDAQIEIVGSCTPAAANVKVDFTDDKIQRATTADLSYCPPPPSTTTSTTSTTTTTLPPRITTPHTTTTTTVHATTTAATTTTTAQTTTTATTTTTQTTTRASGAKVALVKIQKERFGKHSRFVNVRVNGTPKSVKIDIRLVKKNRKTLRHVQRVVATNKLVRVPQLKLDSTVWTVKVTLVS